MTPTTPLRSSKAALASSKLLTLTRTSTFILSHLEFRHFRPKTGMKNG
eukprot:CAMPEP_0184483274 /NCGR_PEP_ID=MMETSP0113_2-20130426/4920_1 /TAXON_ID=91329 /ORGANISM="Norrisiella sphaerica, Strain BC52" /LENGTH=47 /DNA_ID= /DNA_START= /DNA_END= /DNA_ORIENTATION=